MRGLRFSSQPARFFPFALPGAQPLKQNYCQLIKVRGHPVCPSCEMKSSTHACAWGGQFNLVLFVDVEEKSRRQASFKTSPAVNFTSLIADAGVFPPLFLTLHEFIENVVVPYHQSSYLVLRPFSFAPTRQLWEGCDWIFSTVPQTTKKTVDNLRD